MAMLLEYWDKGVESDGLGVAKNSAPSFEEILEQLKLFFEKQKKEGLNISRVHLHPYGSFFMCYDQNKWHDAKDALIKSAMAVPRYCINPLFPDGNENIMDHIDNFDIGKLPKSFPHPNKAGETITLSEDSLTYDFSLNEDIYCYLQFFIKCKKVYKSAGIGDTISGTGFMYHVPK